MACLISGGVLAMHYTFSSTSEPLIEEGKKRATMGSNIKNRNRELWNRLNDEEREDYKRQVRAAMRDEEREEVDSNSFEFHRLWDIRSEIQAHMAKDDEVAIKAVRELTDKMNFINSHLAEIYNQYDVGNYKRTEPGAKVQALLPSPPPLPPKDEVKQPPKEEAKSKKDDPLKDKRRQGRQQSKKKRSETPCDPMRCKGETCQFKGPHKKEAGVVPPVKTPVSKSKKSNGNMVKLQASSIYPQMTSPLPYHKSTTVLYHESVENSTRIFGLMAKVQFDDGKYWVITEHQLTDGVYVKIDKKDHLLKPLKWIPCGNGLLKYWKLPVLELVIPGTTCCKVGPLPSVASLCYFVSINPKTGQLTFGTSDVMYDTKTQLLSHSVNTENYSCGSILISALTNQVMGLHVMTTGPNSHGHNNYCIPLK